MRRTPSPISPFKPYIVRRHRTLGGCQVLFPLALLDKLVYSAMALALSAMDEEREKGNLAFGVADLVREVSAETEALEGA